VHFAAAMETPVVAIYASEKVDEEWMPSRVSAESVCSEAGKPVSAIQSELITGAIDRLFRARKKR
jgi:ADP-heptose:LPS heptosyltransferase